MRRQEKRKIEVGKASGRGHGKLPAIGGVFRREPGAEEQGAEEQGAVRCARGSLLAQIGQQCDAGAAGNAIGLQFVGVRAGEDWRLAARGRCSGDSEREDPLLDQVAGPLGPRRVFIFREPPSEALRFPLPRFQS
jgi:hypothetical protein